MALKADWLEFGNEFTPEVEQILHYFCKDTTERIIKNVDRLGIEDSGALRSSIHSIVYNNAAGDDRLIRFYYLNYAGYLEQGLGSMWGVDADLTVKGKRHGVKATNVRPVDPIGGSDFSAIPATIRKATSSPAGDVQRGRKHKARPFLHSEIRLHLRGTMKRLALRCAFTASAYLIRGMMATTMQKTKNPKWDETEANTIISELEYMIDQKNKMPMGEKRREKNAKISQYYADNEHKLRKHFIRLVPDENAEAEYAKTMGYIKQLEVRARNI